MKGKNTFLHPRMPRPGSPSQRSQGVTSRSCYHRSTPLCCFCLARPWTRLSRCSVHGVCDTCSFQILERIGHECIICDSEVVTHAWKNDREAERGRILALDGGGVRGLIQLEVLAMLEEEIGLNLPLRCFFDLIVGTSIGEYWNDRPLPY